jgi:hypothetical protein
MLGEKALLSFVSQLSKSMLYGYPTVTVYTDHKNTKHNLAARLALAVDDYGVHFGYILGGTNSLADALSRLPYNERQNPSTLSTASPDLDLDDDTGTHKQRQPRDQTRSHIATTSRPAFEAYQ